MSFSFVYELEPGSKRKTLQHVPNRAQAVAGRGGWAEGLAVRGFVVAPAGRRDIELMINGGQRGQAEHGFDKLQD